MTQPTLPVVHSPFTNLLAARVAFLTQRLHTRMGAWKTHPTPQGVVLRVGECGLGDAGFLPQALRYGGLELQRMSPQAAPPPGDASGGLNIGEIRWPFDAQHSTPVIVPVPEVPLDPESAAPQVLSVLVHATIPASRLRSSRFLAKLQGWVVEVEAGLACRWWEGIGSQDGNHAKSSTLNLHLATRPDEPLTPYAFEQRVLPVLKQACRFARQDGLLVRIDNPSTNFLVYCASQHAIVMRGQPCAEGYQHPG